MKNQIELQSFVDRYLRDSLPNLQIQEVRVGHGDSLDGEDVLLVTVVFSVETAETNRVPVSRLTRNLWSALVGRQDDAFPILSFRTHDEDKRLNVAA